MVTSEGPVAGRATGFKLGDVKAYWTNRGIGFYLSPELAQDATGEDANPIAALATFAVVASGALGAVIAGWAADRFGRTAVTSACMAASGLCALAEATRVSTL